MTHAAPYTLTADRAASQWTELCAALGERPKHLAGHHMRAFPTEAAATAAELMAGMRPGGAHLRTEVAA